MAALANMALVVALALCLVYALQIVLITLRLTRLRWKAMRTRTLTQDEVPPAQRQILDQAATLLLPLGFVYRYSGATEKALVTGTDAWTYSDIYQHGDGHTHAAVSPSDVPEYRQPYALQFVTCLDGGGGVTTVNCYRHYLPFTVPGWEVFDDYLPSLAQAWQRHLERVRTLAQGMMGITVDGVAVCRRLRDVSEQLVPILYAQGDLLPAGAQGHYRMRWLVAVRCALRVVHGQWRAAWVQAATRQGNTPQGQTPAEPQTLDPGAQTDIRAFHAQLALQRSHPMGARNKVWLFLITAVLFLLVGGFWFSWNIVPIVLAVVALHEGGHYLAMRLTGYRNVSVFFLPGLGGLATGDKANATPFEKLFVYLAGPVPGIAVAAVAFWASLSGTWTTPGWLTQFVWIALVINYLNLLPIVPLDGGRVVETFLFARLPLLRFVFAALSCALLFGFGVWLDDTVARVLAVLLALGLPQQWRLMHLARAVRREPQAAWDEAQAVEQMFTSLQQPRFRAWSFAKRASAAMALLPELLGRRPTLVETLGGLGIYAACLFGPFGIAYMALPQLRPAAAMLFNTRTSNIPADDVVAEDRAPTRTPRPDWNARLAQSDKLSRDELLAAYLGAAAHANDFEGVGVAHRHYTAAWGLAQDLPLRDLRRIDALLGLARTDPAPGAQVVHLNQVVQELAQPQGPERAKVAQAKEALAYAENVPAQRIALLRDALALRRDGEETDSPRRAATQLALAQALDANADSSGAQTVLREWVDALPLPSPADRSRRALNQRTARVMAQVQLAWFLIDHDQATDARQLALQALAAIPQKPTASWLEPQQEVLEVLLWAELESRQTADLGARWNALEAARDQMWPGGGSLPKVLVFEIDRVLVGNALGDARLQREGSAGIQESLARFKRRPVPLCDSSSKDQIPWGGWHSRQREARARILTQMGACKTL